MSLVYAREDLTPELWAEATPLLHAHWREVAHFEDIPLEPDYEVYAASQKAGFIRCFTVRLDDRNERYRLPLVGYALFFVRPHPHYMSCLFAAQDVIYVDPDHRGLGGKFIEYCDGWLQAEGVDVVTQHVKAAHDFGKLLERKGYVEMDRIYVKRLSVRETLRASA
jgi:GNAT superfamily N-acetyltransferase